MQLNSRRIISLALAALLAGCQVAPQQVQEAEPEPVAPPIQAPLATHEFEFNPETDQVIGTLQVTRASAEDTLSDIARRFNLGYEEIVRANPGVDPWLPGEGREIVLPTQYVLPQAPREGIVINLAQLRMYYFPKTKQGEPRRVITHPIGIGKVGWSTPEGTTKVTAKAKNPTWFPPASVRKEHAKAGEKLPARVPPGPDNPLGTHMMRLGWPSYLIHGTNKPYGVGLRSSHGCVRFYPEDIGVLYDQVPVGTKVTVVNQPFVFGWQDNVLYVQAFPVLEDDKRDHSKAVENFINTAISKEMWAQIEEHGAVIDVEFLNSLVAEARGIAVPVSQQGITLEKLVFDARHVENALPDGANWDGSEETHFRAEDFEAARKRQLLRRSQAPVAEPAAATAKAGAQQ
jgi:L,D-transpeptidase ErfK/SrfK